MAAGHSPPRTAAARVDEISPRRSLSLAQTLTHIRSPPPLSPSLALALSPHCPSAPVAALRSIPRPPCPNRHFAVSYAVAALDYVTSASPLELGATAPAATSSSSTFGRRRSPPRFAASSLPEHAAVPLQPRREPLPLLACPFSLARPLAASPRAPERRAAELAAGKAPVTFWSRAQARCTPRRA